MTKKVALLFFIFSLFALILVCISIYFLGISASSITVLKALHVLVLITVFVAIITVVSAYICISLFSKQGEVSDIFKKHRDPAARNKEHSHQAAHRNEETKTEKNRNEMILSTRQEEDEFSTVLGSLGYQMNDLINQRNILIEVLTNSGDGLIAVDNLYNILMFNKSAETLTGIENQSAIGKQIDEVIHFYDSKDLINAKLYIGQSEKIAQRFKTEGLSLNLDKETSLVLSIVTSSFKLADNNIGWIIILKDISKEKANEVLKIDFVSMAAHELRTPLTSVRGFASLLKMQKESLLDDDGKVMLDRLLISSAILSNLIENLLNVTRIEQNRFTITAVPVDLTEIIKDTVNNLIGQAGLKKQTLELHINGTLPIVLADSFRITEVLTNLVANAIHYTDTNGKITVVAENKDGYLQIAVSDTGEGITAEALPKLFTKFFRVSSNVTEGAKGTGLGLFITKSIIDLHKGKIWVSSELGKGSTFTFILPSANEQMLKN